MANVTKVPASGGSLDPSNNDRVSAAPKKNFGDLMKIDKTDPEQKKKKQQKGEAEEKRKTETTLAQGEKIHKPSPGTLANFEKKTQKIEKMGESEKRQAKQERRIAEEIEESSNNVALPRTEKLFEISSQESSTDRAISSRKARPSEEPPIEQPSDVEKPEKESASKKIATKKNDPKKTVPVPAHPVSTPINTPNLLSAASSVAPVYASLKPEVFALFERLIGSMSVMNTSGITETTIELNSSEFSTFAGAKIVITEHSTAPKVFNIEFLGSAQTVALFNDSSASLVAAFKNGNYAFQVNRIDASLLKTDRPLFQRKQNPQDKQEKDKDKPDS